MPSNPYAPNVNVQCPSSSTTSTQLLRTLLPQNQTLHPQEQAYIQSRKPQVQQAWQDWIQGPEIGYNMSQFDQDSYPVVGLAISGGGFRASLFGAGVLNAFDARNDTSKAFGTGGLYNVLTYVAGASGGSWVISSQLFNPNAKSFFNLVLGGDGDEQGWLLDIDAAFPNGENFLDSKNEEYYGAIVANTKAKAATSIPVSVTDIWAGLLSYHFLNGTTRDNFFTSDADTPHGAGLLWSDIPSTPLFQNHAMPFPLVVADSRGPNSDGKRPGLEDVVYEINPFEWGSWDPTLSSMMNLEFAGTTLNEGTPPNATSCVTGFDQAAYIIGTSSNLWDSASFVLSSEAGTLQFLGPLGDALENLIAKIVSKGQDTALWPNAFGGLNKALFQNALTPTLNLDDGGENAANVPIEALMLKPRQVDVVVAVDSTAETTLGTKHNYPNGTSMNTAATRLRTILSQTHQQAPPIPPDFAATGNNLRVSFFGCDPESDSSSDGDNVTPLIIYVPNSPPCTGDNPVTNTGAFKTSYTTLLQNTFFSQTFLSATCGFVPNTTSQDPNFPLCLKCAAIDRARTKNNNNNNTTTPPIPRSEICQQCFTRYCFNPSDPPTNADLPGRKFIFVDPDPQSSLSKFTNFVETHAVPLFISFAVLSLLLVGVCGFFAYRRRKRRRERVKMVRMYGWGAVAEMDKVDQKKRLANVMPNNNAKSRRRGGGFGYYSNLVKSKLGIRDRYFKLGDPYEFEFELEDAADHGHGGGGVGKMAAGDVGGRVVAAADLPDAKSSTPPPPLSTPGSNTDTRSFTLQQEQEQEQPPLFITQGRLTPNPEIRRRQSTFMSMYTDPFIDEQEFNPYDTSDKEGNEPLVGKREAKKTTSTLRIVPVSLSQTQAWTTTEEERVLHDSPVEETGPLRD